MSRSTDPGHFFQSSAALSESSRKAAKSKNSFGDPIKLPSKILAVAADPDDAGRVYVAEAAGTVRRVVLEVSEIAHAFVGPSAPLTCLTLSNTRPRTVFAGCWDKSIWSWSVDDRKLQRRYSGHSDFVKALVYLQLGGRAVLVSGGADAAIIVWDVESGQQLHKLRGHARGVLALAIRPPGLDPDSVNNETEQGGENVTIFSADSTREIRRWSLGAASATEFSSNPATGPQPILIHETSVYALHFTSSGDLWTASADKTAQCLVQDSGRATDEWVVDACLQHPDFVKDVVVDEGGGWAVTACRDEEVRVFRTSDHKLYHTFSGHFEEVTGLTFVEKSKLVLSVSIDGTIRRWSLEDKKLEKAKEEAERAKAENAGEEELKESLLTEEEEAELRELMEDSE